MDPEAFVLAHLPPVPARVLEVGCGEGALAKALARAGYAVTGIDPKAPEGPLFRRVTLEELADPGPLDAVVASLSLHHVENLATALDRIDALLGPRGVVVVNEFAKERLDRPTAEWYFERRHALAAARGAAAAPGSIDECLREWVDDHADLHGYEAMRAGLDSRFRERYFAWVPYLHHELGQVASEAEEQELIDSGAIRATGFRYVGETAGR
ncbi:MAG: class I SAM-dependent methyltransferase [Gaiellaceae bacterium]